MKKVIQFVIFGLFTSFSSCVAPANYYQVYKTAYPKDVVLNDLGLVFENEHLVVSYNFWSDGGDAGFGIYNKSKHNIYVNLAESFFILNGVAYDYFKNRVYTKSESSAVSAASSAVASKSLTTSHSNNFVQTNDFGILSSRVVGNSSGFSVSYGEEKIICIPPRTTKYFREYAINESLYRECDLLKYPSRKQMKTKIFLREESPLVFSNRIAYSLSQLDELIRIENEFFVSEIGNYPQSEVSVTKPEKFCDQESFNMQSFFTVSSPDKFYIKYSKGTDIWRY